MASQTGQFNNLAIHKHQFHKYQQLFTIMAPQNS